MKTTESVCPCVSDPVFSGAVSTLGVFKGMNASHASTFVCPVLSVTVVVFGDESVESEERRCAHALTHLQQTYPLQPLGPRWQVKMGLNVLL